MNESLQPAEAELVRRCETLMAHAWMVRTFIKHGEEVEEFPELMGIVRAVFDTSRALETRVEEPPAYLKMLRKKLPRFRKAVEQFTHDAPLASAHTNFVQAVVSIRGVVDELERLVDSQASPAPPHVALPIKSGSLSSPAAPNSADSTNESSRPA